MVSNNIHLVNPGREIQKNVYKPLSNIQLLEYFINFGLFSIIQELKENGISVSFHDYCRGYQRRELEESLGNCANLVGISIISAFNSPSANTILDDIKAFNKDNITIIGGQHYIGQLKSKAFQMFPNADIVVSDEGELSMLEIAKQWNKNGSNLSNWDILSLPSNVMIRSDKSFIQGCSDFKVIDINKLQNYSYKYYPNINKSFPSVEFSRGCPHHCVYCANTKSNRENYRSRTPESLKKSVIDILDIYPQRPLRFYLQASSFFLANNEIETFINSFSNFHNDIEWRTEVRVDTLDEKLFSKLYRVGLRIIDIGLDSASAETINIMKKSADPEQYLRKASGMLRAAKTAGIFTKINSLIFPGDTTATLAESKKWLLDNKEFISAISIYPSLLFPGSELEQDFEYYQKIYGTKLIINPALSQWDVFEMDPSSWLTMNEAQIYSLEISQSVNTRENYAYARAFGYHGSEVGYDDILAFLPFKKDNPMTPYHDT